MDWTNKPLPQYKNYAALWVVCWLAGLLAGCILPPTEAEQRRLQFQAQSQRQGITGRQLVRFLALGDSYTIGESVNEPERWPVQLADRLHQAGFAVDKPQIIARTGWTTAELAVGIQQAQPQGSFDLVSLLIGVNNQYRQRGSEEYREEFRDLLQQAIAFAGADAQHVLVLSIPDWGVTPFAAGRNRAEIAQQIDLFNAINWAEASAAGVRYVDITPISRQAVDDPTLIAEDGLHPSGKMYAAWVELVLPEAMIILKN